MIEDADKLAAAILAAAILRQGGETSEQAAVRNYKRVLEEIERQRATDPKLDFSKL